MEKHKTGIRRKITLIVCLAVGIIIAIGIGLGYFIGQSILNEIFAKYRLESAEMLAPLNKLILYLVALTAFLIIIMVLLGYILSGMLTRPITKLRQAVEQIAKGDLNYRIEIKTGDEIGELADSFRDMVTTIKEKQKENQESRVYAENIVSSMTDTLIVVTPEGSIKSVNKAACDLLGYTAEEIINQPVGMIFAEEEEEELLFKGKRLRKLIAEGTVRNFDMTYVTKSGEKIPVSFSGSVMYESNTDEHGLKEQMDTDVKTRINADEEKLMLADEKDVPRPASNVPRIIGVVGVARDMRETKRFIADLEKSKKELRNWSETLEKKVDERTKDLTQSQEATLNIMEDLTEEKETLQKQTIELDKARKELELFSKGLEDKVKERTAELSILYEVSNAISYTLDYQMLLKLIMESLFKIVDYDICGSLLFDARTANITLKPVYAGSAGFVDEIRSSLIGSASALAGEDIRKKHLNVFLIPSAPDFKPKEERNLDELRSFFNVPFVVRGKIIGMINVSSCKDNAFSEEDIKLIYTIANQASNAIERLQAVITAEKSKMESMVESMVEGVIMIDELGEIVVLNPQARKMLGFGLDKDVPNKALAGKMKTVSLDKALEECQEKKCLITKEVVLPGEENMVLRCDMSPVKNIEGEIIGIVIILQDITREKEVDRMKTEFISTVSHELRTPLAITKEGLSLILDKVYGQLNETQEEILNNSRNNIERLSRIINDLLDVSKMEARKIELKREIIDLTVLVQEVILTFEIKAKAKGLELKAVFPNKEIMLYADADKLIQIFTNLINNALKFTRTGYIEISLKDGDAEVECTVADTGIGIAEDNLSKVFSRFQQFSRVDGPGEKGTGLGLAIAKGLVEMHQGRIRVESQIGQGTKFIFVLPKSNAQKLFLEYINKAISNIAKPDSKISFILVSLLEADHLEQPISKQAQSFTLKDIERLIKGSLYRDTDLVTRIGAEIIILLEECNKDNSLSVRERLKQVVADYLNREKLGDSVIIKFGCATYPDDAKDGKALLNKARETQSS